MERWFVLPNNSEILAVHAALMHTGEVLYFSGDENDRGRHDTNQFDKTCLFDCGSHAITNRNPHSIGPFVANPYHTSYTCPPSVTVPMLLTNRNQRPSAR
jgi:hypothetical protein